MRSGSTGTSSGRRHAGRLLAACAVAGGAWLSLASPAAAAGNGSVLADVQCDADHHGVLDVTLVNDDAATVTFVVDGDQAIEVAPNSAHAITYTNLADGVVRVPVTVDGVDASVTVTVSCSVEQIEVMQAGPARFSDTGDTLPRTGTSTTYGLLIGGVLVAAGVAASLVARRRYS